MTETLHLTNGDHAVEVLRAAGMQGEIVPWRDVLHEGPVRADLPLEALSRLRARFIAEAGWAKLDEVDDLSHGIHVLRVHLVGLDHHPELPLEERDHPYKGQRAHDPTRDELRIIFEDAVVLLAKKLA